MKKLILLFLILWLAASALGQKNPPAIAAFIDVNVIPMDKERVLPH
jgi:hypothetical protein